MVFVFGVDVPLVEILLALVIIAFLIFVEATVVLIIMLYQMRHSKQLISSLEKQVRRTQKMAKKSKRQ